MRISIWTVLAVLLITGLQGCKKENKNPASLIKGKWQYDSRVIKIYHNGVLNNTITDGDETGTTFMYLDDNNKGQVIKADIPQASFDYAVNSTQLNMTNYITYANGEPSVPTSVNYNILVLNQDILHLHREDIQQVDTVEQKAVIITLYSRAR